MRYLQSSICIAFGFLRDGCTYTPQPQVKSSASFSTEPVLIELMSPSVCWGFGKFTYSKLPQIGSQSSKFIENFNSLINKALTTAISRFSSSYKEYRNFKEDPKKHHRAERESDFCKIKNTASSACPPRTYSQYPNSECSTQGSKYQRCFERSLAIVRATLQRDHT